MIIGHRPYMEAMAKDVRGGLHDGLTEYGRDPHRARPTVPEPRGIRRMVTTIADAGRSALGMPSSAEIGDAERSIAAASGSGAVDQTAAVRIARRLAGAGRAELVRELPEAWSLRLPRNETLRTPEIARLAIDVVHRHVDDGPSNRLPADLARATRIAAVADAASHPSRGVAFSESLQTRSKAISDDVRAYLSIGPETRAGMENQVDRNAPKGVSIGMEHLEEQMARARLGMMEPRDVVANARLFAEDRASLSPSEREDAARHGRTTDPLRWEVPAEVQAEIRRGRGERTPGAERSDEMRASAPASVQFHAGRLRGDGFGR